MKDSIINALGFIATLIGGVMILHYSYNGFYTYIGMVIFFLGTAHMMFGIDVNDENF